MPDASETIEQIASNTVDPSKTIEQNSSKTIKAGTEKYFLTFIYSLLSESISLTTLFGRNTAKQISILATDQPTNTNRTKMEHISFPEVTIGLKYLAIGSARLDKNIVAEAN